MENITSMDLDALLSNNEENEKKEVLKFLYTRHQVDPVNGMRHFKDAKCDIITCKRIAGYYGRVNDVFNTIFFVPHTIKLCWFHKDTLCKNDLTKIPYVDDGLRLVCQKCGHKWISNLFKEGEGYDKNLPRACPKCDSWLWRG